MPLSTSGAVKVAGELERLCAGLQPFSAKTFAEFTDFLAQAETYQREGTLKPAGKSRGRAAAAADGSKVEIATRQVQQLYERAADPALQYVTIDSEINKIGKALNKDEVLAVAAAVGVVVTKKTKTAALDELKRMIRTRKDSYDRSLFGAAVPVGPSPD